MKERGDSVSKTIPVFESSKPLYIQGRRMSFSTLQTHVQFPKTLKATLLTEPRAVRLIYNTFLKERIYQPVTFRGMMQLLFELGATKELVGRPLMDYGADWNFQHIFMFCSCAIAFKTRL